MALHNLLHHNEYLAKQIRHSHVMLACDNFFTSPMLFLSLAAHRIYAVCTLSSTLRGAAAAKKWWVENEKKSSGGNDTLSLR